MCFLKIDIQRRSHMSHHYNAFISYKHAPEDNLVADAIHKGLEHFHIPGKLQKKTGVKKIDRIFRDKAELPITNDLSDNISEALENSDHLIVLCSTNTHKSAWVVREIECFLKNHTKRDVFTVLVNGEPQDVIPEILQYEEQTVVSEDGSTQTVRVPVEPLSCDYRISPKKAKKTELPRLVSGLIGCAYDDIINRHRQYRMRQLTALFSVIMAVALGFAGYMLYSRNMIRTNYEQSLKNQSIYLANESENLLEKEQRITALQLAIEALPKDASDDRPLTAQALRALTDATLAYVGNDGTNINADWNYQMPNNVSDFQVSPDGKYIAVLDTGNVLGVWDTGTHERLIFLEDEEEKLLNIAFAKDVLIVMTGSNASGYDCASAKKIWDAPINDDSYQSDVPMITETSAILITDKDKYLELDTATGRVKKETTLDVKDKFENFDVVESKPSSDGSHIAFRGLIDWNKYAYGVLDTSTGKAVISDPVDEMVKEIEWADEHSIMIASTKIDNTGSMSYGESEIVSPDHNTLKCVDSLTLSEKWSSDFVCNGVNINSGFFDLNESRAAYFSGNVINVFDKLTGKTLYSNNVNDSVLDVSDRDGDGTPVYITENGGYAVPVSGVDAGAVHYTKYFTDELRQVVINNGVYVRKSLGSEVIHYGIHVYDKEWTAFSEDTCLSGTPAGWCMGDKHLAILSGEGAPVLYIYGLDDGKKPVTIALDGEKPYDYRLLGIHAGKAYLGYNNSGSYTLITVPLDGGEPQREELFKVYLSFENSAVMSNGKLIYICQGEGAGSELVIRDTDTAAENKTAIPEDIGYIGHAPVYYSDDGIIYVQGETGYIYDVEKNTWTKAPAPERWDKAAYFSDNTADGVYAVSDAKKIVLSDKSGAIKSTITCPGVAPLGMTFAGGYLMVVYNDGSLYKYGMDGEFEARADIVEYFGFDGSVEFRYDDKRGELYIGMGVLTDVVDIDSMVMTAHIENCLGYYADRDIFITTSGDSRDKKNVGYYKRYTPDMLIKKAHDILKGTTMSEAMRSRFGL